MQVYILMQSAGAPAGPFGQAAQNADERRRAVCRAQGKFRFRGRCRRRRYGQALGSPFGGAAERMRS